MAQWIGNEWCFTVNAPKNCDELEAENFIHPIYNSLGNIDCKYLCVRGEVGEQGNFHLQGFVIFNEKRKFKDVKEEIHRTCHLEKRAKTSSAEAASDYVCHRGKHENKGGKWPMFPLLEYGVFPGTENEKAVLTCGIRNPWADSHWKTCEKCKPFVLKSYDDFEKYTELLKLG